MCVSKLVKGLVYMANVLNSKGEVTPSSFVQTRRIQSVYDKVAFQKEALKVFKLACGDPVSVSEMQIRGIVAGRRVRCEPVVEKVSSVGLESADLNLDHVDDNDLAQLGVHDDTEDDDMGDTNTWHIYIHMPGMGKTGSSFCASTWPSLRPLTDPSCNKPGLHIRLYV
ncbi:hypothetical protein SARC_09351 [Sphaeroforma arctica JP610]|uniref:Uncharacterized protein n=1 Tax=Sphaeroforma arctica JP610 TaxID=667725 RepID=A0A0L0FP07_9EUKA|nr:hypothetical protein SARC_09351 [Sphaeroforma arctica JP610]KNC78211.1 hypothetical protein SARC_09351 [Sphaeroforma arctica JP610]|eukprot:XP_014152113.1 hypothetical protein SARC_09351 [Sphaeroforma arctica JP610]